MSHTSAARTSGTRNVGFNDFISKMTRPALQAKWHWAPSLLCWSDPEWSILGVEWVQSAKGALGRIIIEGVQRAAFSVLGHWRVLTPVDFQADFESGLTLGHWSVDKGDSYNGSGVTDCKS